MSSRKSEAWIFVSHSVRDLEAVRKIRNEVEARGGNPILFYLKQQVDDDLLRRFLLREIEARNFFILCDSSNSRSSPYVQLEVDHVQGLKHVKQVTIDLGASWDQQVRAIEALLSEATIFASYAHADRSRTQPYLEFLALEDFAVFDPASSIMPGGTWQQAIQDAIAEAAREGYFLQFLTQKSSSSAFAGSEFAYFLGASGGAKSGRSPILVALDPISSMQLPINMAQYSVIDASGIPFDVACAHIKRSLGL